MFCYVSYLHDEPVRVDDQEERREVAEQRVHQDVALAQPVVGQVVSSAGSHVTLRYIPTHQYSTRFINVLVLV